MAEPYATVGVTVIDGGVMHARTWEVPAGVAAELGRRWTAVFGPPDEMLADPDAVAGDMLRTAEENGTVYMLRDGQP